MVKRALSELAIYQIEKDTELLDKSCLYDLYQKKTSEIIYITKEKKLYGIICLKEAVYCFENGKVQINKTFTSLKGFNVIKAHEIFQKRNIHKIPVVNAEGELLGDYSRWDDLLYIERNQRNLLKKEIVRKVLEPYEEIYVVRPVEGKIYIFRQLIQYLEMCGIRYTVFDKEQVGEILYDKVICIFGDEDERKGMQCYHGIAPAFGKKNDILVDSCWKLRMATYKSLLTQIAEELLMKRLKIEDCSWSEFQGIDKKATFFLSALQEKGICCFGLCEDEREMTEYGKRLKNEIREKIKQNPRIQEEQWPEGKEGKEFYGELYRNADYENGAAQREIFEGSHTFEFKQNITGKYFNARNGIRITCFQPKEYIGTIYLLGPCTIIGAYTEDQYTVASLLQKKLLRQGLMYRVENYGDLLRPDAAIDSRLEMIGQFGLNDIVIYLSRAGEVIHILESRSLEKIFAKGQVSSGWIKDSYTHCNHKICDLIADNILEMICPCLSKGTDCYGEKISVNFQDVMEQYIHSRYLSFLNCFFADKECAAVGAIVMNGNPFTRGHYYLVEQARRQVDFLIVFVVEEDASLFPFEERFEMIKQGVKGIGNVVVVPSGEFILSHNNFQQYFWKSEDEAAVCNAEYDINIFADHIAKPLHITHRFVGSEPIDKTTKIYNEAMQKILPKKGIAYVEIPRITVDNEIISASRVREYMRKEEYGQAFAMLPETTKQYFAKQIENDNGKV